MSEVVINPDRYRDKQPWRCIWCAERFEHNQSIYREHFTVFAARFVTQIIFTDQHQEQLR